MSEDNEVVGSHIPPAAAPSAVSEAQVAAHDHAGAQVDAAAGELDSQAGPGPDETESVEPVLELVDLEVFYGKVQALHGISLKVYPGEIVTLIGANGAGKTTTLKTISGLRKVASGRLLLDGEDITAVPPHKRPGMGLCQAPEGRGIFPGMTVIENLDLGTFPLGKHDKEQFHEDLDRAFELFPRLKEREKQFAGTLSGGEQQMLAIGRALMAHPRVLLLDEPSMGLAPMLVQQIFEIITEINEAGTTVLLVEQNAAQALSRADRAYVLEVGHVTKTGSARELLHDDSIKAAYLGHGA